ncbi:MAG TPA: C39 family peptidase [Candidatus Saccharimonadales bacterium]|nr:C39 family peptidase [Candidatus Saccharimonadales bacterium]
MRISRFNYFFTATIIIFCLAGLEVFGFLKLHRRATSTTATTAQSSSPAVTTTAPTTATTAPAAKIPASYSLKVPFIVQAPFANWDARHEDACEEASLITVHYYLTNTKVANLNAGDADITALINWENAHGYGPSITVEQLSKIAGDFYGLNSGRVIVNPTIAEMKAEIAAGRPIIVPAAGKLLDNPNFKNGGPNYHMLVIRSYDTNIFITSDPGTRNGDGYTYPYTTLMNAIHDWDANNILNGQRAVLVFN